MENPSGLQLLTFANTHRVHKLHLYDFHPESSYVAFGIISIRFNSVQLLLFPKGSFGALANGRQPAGSQWLHSRQEVIRLFWLFEQMSAETGSIWIIIETKKVNDGHHRLKWSPPLIKDYDQRLHREDPRGVLGENASMTSVERFQWSAFGEELSERKKNQSIRTPVGL